jgi:hypothetical protein
VTYTKYGPWPPSAPVNDKTLFTAFDQGIYDAHNIAESHIADTSDAHDASAISFAPTDTVSGTDVQAALAEVAAEAGGPIRYVNTSVPAGNTVSNTSAETTFASSYTIPSSMFVAGKPLRITLRGTVTNTTATARSHTFRIKLGSIAVFTSGAAAIPANFGTTGFDIDAILTPFSTGSSGQIEAQGSGGNGVGNSLNDSPNTTPLTINTLTDQALTVTVTMPVISTGLSATLRTLMVEAL